MTSPPPLPRFPWREAVRRIVAGSFGAGLLGAGIVDFLGVELRGRVAEHSHPGWLTFAVMFLGFTLLILALDFDNKVLNFAGGIAKSIPLPWSKKSE